MGGYISGICARAGLLTPTTHHCPPTTTTHRRSVRISALALLKMATHARAGGDIEVMGVMQGKVRAAAAAPSTGHSKHTNEPKNNESTDKPTAH